MPVRTKFTKAEIAAIKKRHNEIVAQLNKNLSEELQIRPGNMEEVLNNPKAAAAYEIASKVKKRNLKQAEIHQKLTGMGVEDISRAGHYPFYTKFRVDGTKESEEYNKALVENYNNGGNLRQDFQGFKKVLDASAKELYELGDDPVKLAEYYRDNYEMCENAYVLSQYIKNNSPKLDSFTKEFRDQLPTMEKLIDLVSYPREVALQYGSIEDLAFPKLSKEQATYFLAHNQEVDAQYLNTPAKKAMQDPIPCPKEYFDKIDNDVGLGISGANEFVTKYIAYTLKDGKRDKFVSIDDSFKPGTRSKTILGVVDESKAAWFEAESINKSTQDIYLKKWGEAFNARRFGHENEKFDLHAIEEQNKGGFWERRVFRNTSQEYKNMLQALKDYHNPASDKYLNDDNLREAAEAYREHQKAQGYDDGTKTLKGTALGRRHIADAIIDTLDEKEKLVNATYQECEKPIIPEPDVEESYGLNDLFQEELEQAVNLDAPLEQVEENVAENQVENVNELKEDLVA